MLMHIYLGPRMVIVYPAMDACMQAAISCDKVCYYIAISYNCTMYAVMRLFMEYTYSYIL